MSTDTAFALGVLALVAPRATRLRVRLLTIVVIDDLVALLVIATVYTEESTSLPLAIAAALFGLKLALQPGAGDLAAAGRARGRGGHVGRAVRVGRRPAASPGSPSGSSRARTRRRAATSSGRPS